MCRQGTMGAAYCSFVLVFYDRSHQQLALASTEQRKYYNTWYYVTALKLATSLVSHRGKYYKPLKLVTVNFDRFEIRNSQLQMI